MAGRGVVSSSRCSRAVPASAAIAAQTGMIVIALSTSAPLRCAVWMPRSKTFVRMSTPTMAIPAATTAVATPPAHSRLPMTSTSPSSHERCG